MVIDDRPSFANAARFPDASRVVCKPFPEAIAGLELSAHDYVAVIWIEPLSPKKQSKDG